MNNAPPSVSLALFPLNVELTTFTLFPLTCIAPPIGAVLFSKMHELILTLISFPIRPVLIAPPYTPALLLMKIQLNNSPSACNEVAPPTLLQ